ncbi:MAG: serine/threonine-protein kinase, partial [Cyanobacteria bacterium J06641_5]
LIDKRYRALKLIATGGFGRTFLAQDDLHPKKARCAIKQFYPERPDLRQAGRSQQAIALFHAEADRLQQLGAHPQIPSLLTHAEQESYQYIVQEFIDGPNLDEDLATNGPFTETQIRDLLTSLLPVLDFIHRGQVIHRDVKPANIIRRRDDGDRPAALVLVDFGAAKYATATSLAKTGTLIGSAGYAAPEQLFGKPIYASDLYGLGVTCIHLLTQTDPFDLYDPSNGRFVWRDYLAGNPISARLAAVLDRAIAPSVQNRFRSAREMLQALAGSTPLPNRSTRIVPLQLRGHLRVSDLKGLRDNVRALAFSPDGKFLAASSTTEGGFLLGKNSTVQLFDAARGDRQHQFVQRPGNWIFALAFSPDGRHLAGGGQDGAIALWDLELLQCIGKLEDRTDTPIRNLVFSPDGLFLVSASLDGILRIWDAPNQQLSRTLPQTLNASCALAFSPDGQLLAIDGPDRTIELWDMTLGTPLQPLVGHTDRVESLAFSPDGQLLASGSGDWEGNIRLWDVQTGETIVTWTNCGATVRSLQFSPDGRLLLSSGGDRFVRLWDVAGNRLLRLLRGHQAPVNRVAFCPSGRH